MNQTDINIFFGNRYIIKQDDSIPFINIGGGKSFDFSKLQKEKKRSWHSRPYEYAFATNGLIFAIRENLIIPNNVLDMACGENHPGYMALANLKETKQIYASDLNKGLINNGMEHKKVKKIIENSLQSSFKNNFFDSIVCISAIEHISHFDKLFSEMYRILKNGGICFITFDISTNISNTIKHKVDNKLPIDYMKSAIRSGFKIIGDYNDSMSKDAIDSVNSKYPLAQSIFELNTFQHNNLKTFRMVIKK